MVNINTVFQSDYLKASDLDDQPHLATITEVELKTMNDGEQKLCVSFQEWDKSLLLNKTNANNIAAFCGPETDGWVGRQIVMAPALVDYQGKTVEAIRVRAPKPKPKAAPAQAPARSGPPPGHPANLDDEVPFMYEFR